MDDRVHELAVLTGLSFAACLLAFAGDYYITAAAFAGLTCISGVLALAHRRLPYVELRRQRAPPQY